MVSYINNHLVDDIILEGLTTLCNDQLSSNRYKYMEIARESVLNPEGKSKMIQKLYADIIAKSNIDYGKIPLSKGNLTTYEYYENISKTLEILNSLLDGKNVEELALTNKLHDLIITCRSDYEFGFRFDIEFIKLTYNTLVMTLHDMINLCIVAYVDYLKEVKHIEFQFKTFKRSDRMVIKATRDFLKSYDKGEWLKIMAQFKKNSSNMIGALLTYAATLPASVTIGGGVILGIIALLFSIRTLIYLYYSSAMKINQYIKIQSDFLKVSIDSASDGDSDSLDKQKRLLETLSSISNSIETRVLKTEKDASKEIKDSNSTNFTSQELRNTNDSIGIELL